MPVISSKYASLLILIIFILPGCNTNQSTVIPLSYSIPAVNSCKDEPDHNYYLSKPENISAPNRIPLIIAIDPHGDGKLAAQKFSDALGNIPAYIAGSDKLRNNYAGFESSLSHLINDVLSKYPVDPEKIIVAGFSGGARMAYYYGMKHKVLGIIMFGAGPGQLNGKTGSKRVYAVSGTRDFNFMEQYVPPFSNLEAEMEYTSDFFRGTHEWPPARYIHESVAYILKDQSDRLVSISKQLSRELLSEYDSLLRLNDLFFAAKSLEKAWNFDQNPQNKKQIAEKINEFKNLSGWIDYQKKFDSYLQKEQQLKQAYVDKLVDPDTSWWKKEINSLDQNLLSCSDPVKEDFFYRIKGFTGIILYSRINALLQNEVLTNELASLLVIYEQAEPESPDLIDFKARVRELGIK